MGDDAVSEEQDLVGVLLRLGSTVRVVVIHPSGHPIIHSTNLGLRTPPPVPVLSPRCKDPRDVAPRFESTLRTTRSVSVVPLCRPLASVQFPATPPAFASFAVTVGIEPRARSACTAADSCPLLAAELRLGRPALGRSFSPPTPLIPFWLEP